MTIDSLPASVPPDALAQLDAAARVLHELASRGHVLRIETDDRSRSLRIELDGGAGRRHLTPRQLLDLLAGV